jgi:putative transposase
MADRTWVCKGCGAELDRDVNAAISIRQEACRMLGIA